MEVYGKLERVKAEVKSEARTVSCSRIVKSQKMHDAARAVFDKQGVHDEADRRSIVMHAGAKAKANHQQQPLSIKLEKWAKAKDLFPCDAGRHRSTTVGVVAKDTKAPSFQQVACEDRYPPKPCPECKEAGEFDYDWESGACAECRWSNPRPVRAIAAAIAGAPSEEARIKAGAAHNEIKERFEGSAAKFSAVSKRGNAKEVTLPSERGNAPYGSYFPNELRDRGLATEKEPTVITQETSSGSLATAAGLGRTENEKFHDLILSSNLRTAELEAYEK